VKLIKNRISERLNIDGGKGKKGKAIPVTGHEAP
jgi:hypothetical protein